MARCCKFGNGVYYHTLARRNVHGRLCQSVIRTTLKVNGKAWNSTPRHSKTPEQMATKIGRGDYVLDVYPYAKLHYDPIRGFCPPHMRMPTKSPLGQFFSGCSNSLPPRPLRRFWRSIRQTTSFRAGCAFWGSREQIFTFWPHFRQKRIFGRFSTGLQKFWLKTGVNMGGFVSKHPLNDLRDADVKIGTGGKILTWRTFVFRNQK